MSKHFHHSSCSCLAGLSRRGVMGGLMGLGKTLKPSGQINESLFTSMDTDRENVIHIPGARAQVLSAQPVSSYELLPAGDEVMLRILDPKEFRTVRHLVIMTG